MPNNDFDVFISYSTKNKTIADALVAYLEQQEIGCWIAPRNIEGGLDYAEEIVDAISRIKVFVLIFSAQSSQSKHVPREIGVAAHFDKFIIPFRTDDTPLKGFFLYYLSTLQWIEAGSVIKKHFPEVEKAVRQHLRKKEPVIGTAIAPCSFGVVCNPLSMIADGLLYAIRSLSPRSKDPANALKQVRFAAEQGDPEAQNRLGICYTNGIGVRKAPEEAVKWFRKAAEQGFAKAQYDLGLCYERGFGVSKDPAEAEKWFLEAEKRMNRKTSDAG